MEPNVSLGFNISLKNESETMDFDSQNYPGAVLLFIASLFYFEAAVKIYKKHKNELEPLHIFELNTLISIAVGFGCSAYKWTNIWHICSSVNQWLIHYCKLSFSVGIILSQLDRFFALYWHTKYKGRVTPRLAMVSVIPPPIPFYIIFFFLLENSFLELDHSDNGVVDRNDSFSRSSPMC